MTPSYQQNNGLKNEATEPTDILGKKKGIYTSPMIQLHNTVTYALQRSLLDDPEKIFLNNGSEIISQCHHKNKYRLKTLASSMTSGDII